MSSLTQQKLRTRAWHLCRLELDMNDVLEPSWTLTVARDEVSPPARAWCCWKLISKGQRLNVWNYIVITQPTTDASNLQIAQQEIKRSFCFHYIHDPISYLSISCCCVKEASFSVAAAQSVSVSGVEDQPAHQILSSMLKLKDFFKTRFFLSLFYYIF